MTTKPTATRRFKISLIAALLGAALVGAMVVAAHRYFAVQNLAPQDVPPRLQQSSTAPPYTEKFLAHLKANAPERTRACVVQQVMKRWPTQQNLNAAADAYRITRGETDVVNFAIKSLDCLSSRPVGGGDCCPPADTSQTPNVPTE